MRIGLIAMSGVRVHNAELAALGLTLPGFVRRGKIIATLPSLGLLTVAGLTPASHEIEYIEMEAHDPKADYSRFDLVAISSLAAQIHEAYAIAAHCRRGGIRVVMGGLHVSSLPDEALDHCDAVVVGGAEGVWPLVLQDAERGRLRPRYDGATRDVFSTAHYARPRFDLLRRRPYNRVTVQTSRGCPRDCEFCAASRLIALRFNQKPVPLVIEEVREAKRHVAHPYFEFADDNTFLDKAWSYPFLRALREEHIKWFTETDASVADDPQLCELAAQAGCRQLLIGFESPHEQDLDGMDPAQWKRRRAPASERVIETLQRRGISVNGCFILGLDNHTPDIFEAVANFVRRSGLNQAQITVLTPFPGTSLFARLRRQQRLLQNQFWDRCTLFDVTFRPARMSVEDLEAGLRWLLQEIHGRSGFNPVAATRSAMNKPAGLPLPS